MQNKNLKWNKTTNQLEKTKTWITVLLPALLLDYEVQKFLEA